MDDRERLRRHLRQHGHEQFPAGALRLWVNILNRALFGNRLVRIPVYFAHITDISAHGIFIPDAGNKAIVLDPRHTRTRRDVIATLAHEMVHQEQEQLGLALTHGRQFKRRAARIRRLTGIEI